MKKDILLGFVIGVAANIIGMFLYVLFFIAEPFFETLSASIQNENIGSIIALGAILNLGIFFLLIKRNQIYKARGILLATFVAAFIIMYFKFFY